MSPPENTRQRSNTFAAQNGLPKFEYVLHPRTTGFTFIVERLRKGEDGSHLDGNISSAKAQGYGVLVPDPLMLVDPVGFFFLSPRRVFHTTASHYDTSEILWFLYELMLAVLQGS